MSSPEKEKERGEGKAREREERERGERKRESRAPSHFFNNRNQDKIAHLGGEPGLSLASILLQLLDEEVQKGEPVLHVLCVGQLQRDEQLEEKWITDCAKILSLFIN